MALQALLALSNDLTKSTFSSTPSHLPASCPSPNFIFLQNWTSCRLIPWGCRVPSPGLLLDLGLEFSFSIFCVHCLASFPLFKTPPFSRSSVICSKKSFLKITTPNPLWRVWYVCRVHTRVRPTPWRPLWWPSLCYSYMLSPPDSKCSEDRPMFKLHLHSQWRLIQRHFMDIWTEACLFHKFTTYFLQEFLSFELGREVFPPIHRRTSIPVLVLLH